MKETTYQSWGVFRSCYPPCGYSANHGKCDGENDNSYYRRVCICICHDGERTQVDQKAIMIMRAEAQDREERERQEKESNDRRIARDRARTCQRCGQYFYWVGTGSGYRCGCGSSGNGGLGRAGGPHTLR